MGNGAGKQGAELFPEQEEEDEPSSGEEEATDGEGEASPRGADSQKAAPAPSEKKKKAKKKGGFFSGFGFGGSKAARSSSSARDDYDDYEDDPEAAVQAEGDNLTAKQLERARQRYAALPAATLDAVVDGLPEALAVPFMRRFAEVYDEDGSGDLTEDEYMRMVATLHRTATRANKRALAFKVYDQDRDGVVGFEDLRCTLELVVGAGEAMATLMAQEVLRAHDEDETPGLSKEEFDKLISPDDLAFKFTVDLV